MMAKQNKQDAQFEALYAKAWAAGVDAATAKVPTPMVVGTPSEPFGNDVDFTKEFWVVNAGVCGFAWVKVRPANTAFAKWLKRTGKVRNAAYTGGYDIWIGNYNQSMERKLAHATAMAAVLQDAGIRAYADSRMD